MPNTNETRAGGRGLVDDAFPGGNCSPEITPKADVAQAKSRLKYLAGHLRCLGPRR
jgi:hypothetical protein